MEVAPLLTFLKRMNISQVAVQLYTLRDFLKTPADVAATLKKVAAIGYRAVQVSGMVAMPEEELSAMLNDAGLVCCATHEPTQLLRTQPEKIAARLRKLGCTYTACPGPAGVDCSKVDQVDSMIADLDRAGAVLRQSGQVLTYHNHAIELIPFAGTTLLRLHLREERRPESAGRDRYVLDSIWRG